MALLEVRDLHVSFDTDDGVVQAVRGVSFEVDHGQTLGIVGESGSGKSVSTQTITGLTRGARITGSATFDGMDLLNASDKQLRRVRGDKIGMIFQDPLTSLHPAYKVGWQIEEMVLAHRKSEGRKAARKRAVDLLSLVGIPNAARRVDDYPHQFSGGMRQRVMIAMAMALNPDLLIADEPTTALDVTVQAQVLEVMQRLQQEFDTAIVIITHDLGVIADMADDVVVMYAGTVMERGSRRETFYDNHNPYTEGLLASIPGHAAAKGIRLTPIKGSPPSLINVPPGCAFAPRCPYVFDRCNQERPPLQTIFGSQQHRSACLLTPERGARLELRERLRQAQQQDPSATISESAARAAIPSTSGQAASKGSTK